MSILLLRSTITTLISSLLLISPDTSLITETQNKMLSVYPTFLVASQSQSKITHADTFFINHRSYCYCTKEWIRFTGKQLISLQGLKRGRQIFLELRLNSLELHGIGASSSQNYVIHEDVEKIITGSFTDGVYRYCFPHITEVQSSRARFMVRDSFYITIDYQNRHSCFVVLGKSRFVALCP